jgi:phosphoribosylformylglycinamidine synthase
MDLKRPGNTLIVTSPHSQTGMRNHYRLGSSRFASIFGIPQGASAAVPHVDLELGPRIARHVARLVREGLVESIHDVSDGGLACAVAEMLIAGSTPARPIGASIADAAPDLSRLFGEAPSTYVLEVRPENIERVTRDPTTGHDLPGWTAIGHTTDTGTLEVAGETIGVYELTMAWRGTLDW